MIRVNLRNIAFVFIHRVSVNRSCSKSWLCNYCTLTHWVWALFLFPHMWLCNYCTLTHYVWALCLLQPQWTSCSEGQTIDISLLLPQTVLCLFLHNQFHWVIKISDLISFDKLPYLIHQNKDNRCLFFITVGVINKQCWIYRCILYRYHKSFSINSAIIATPKWHAELPFRYQFNGQVTCVLITTYVHLYLAIFFFKISSSLTGDVFWTDIKKKGS